MKATKDIPKVKLNIRPGQVTPAQKQAKKAFYAKWIASAKREAVK